MPKKPLKPCRHPGCPNLTPNRYCVEHEMQHNKQRASAHQRGYDARWQKDSKMFLQEHPLCVECERNGRLKAATVVDHRIPHKGDKALFKDKSNWQPLCKACHDRKTATEDGGFGRGNIEYKY